MDKTLDGRNKAGVVVGRFQTPYLHNGHKTLIDVANKCESLIVFIGVHPIPSTKSNPLDFETRKDMLEEYINNTLKRREKFFILPIYDHPSDIVWSENLDTTINLIMPNKQVVLFDGRLGFSKRYHGKNAVEILPEVPNESATQLRDEVIKPALSSKDFRDGIIYAINKSYNRISAAVDVVCYQKPNNPAEIRDYKILMGTKAHSPNIWRFPGGIVDSNDDSWEHAAARELYEETNVLVLPSDLKYICSMHVKDWRTTPDNTYKTTFFATEYRTGEVKPKDDLKDVGWIYVKDLANKLVKISGEHQKLFEKFCDYIVKGEKDNV